MSLIHMAQKFYQAGELGIYGDEGLNRLMASENYLEAVLYDPYYSDMFSHSALKHLGFMASPEEVLQHAPLRRDILPLASDPTQKQYPHYFSQAKKTLDEIDFVLLTEEFDASLRLLDDYLGIRSSSPAPYLNMGHQKQKGQRKYRETLPADLVRRIDELTTIDQELYTYAREKFRATIHQANNGNLYTGKV